MNISEKSKEYAEGKALNAITTAIEEAYAEGYRTGYREGYQEYFTFWLNNGDEKSNYRLCAMKNKDSIYGLQFMGCRMPVMIVRH